MRSYYLSSGIFTLGILFFAGLISGFFGYVYSTQHSTKEVGVTTWPHIYYSVKTITALDAQGNSTGNTSVYRVDGMNAQPVKIIDLPKGVTAPIWAPSTIQYDVWSKSGDNPKKFPVAFDTFGHEVWGSYNFKSSTGNRKGDIKTHIQWVHPDGTYATESVIVCSNSPSDDLCDESFTLKVTNLQTNITKEYGASTFGIEDGQWVVRILGALSSTSAVIQIAALQDQQNAFIGEFDFSIGKVLRTLFRGASTPTYDYKPYEYLRMSDDRKSIIFIQWFINESGGKQIIAMDTQTGKVIVILPPTDLRDYIWPVDSPYLYYKIMDNTIYRRNTLTGVENSIYWNGSIDEYLHPQRFTFKWEVSSGGVYNGKVIVIDSLTGKQRIIYDQLRDENAYGQNVNAGSVSHDAQVGDSVYSFLGIEQ